MIDFVFILEDKDDIEFMRDFLIINYCDGDKKCCSGADNKKEREKNVILINGIQIKIVTTSYHEEGNITGGWSKIKEIIGSPLLEKIKLENSKTIFISFLDGDEDKLDNIKKKEKEILDTLNKLNEGKSNAEKFQLIRYYIPYNDKKSFNLEQLLHECKTKPFDECWGNLEECVTVKNKIKNVISSKGKMITYKECFDSLIDKKHQYLSEIWNIDYKTNEHLTPLKEFLNKYLIKNE